MYQQQSSSHDKSDCRRVHPTQVPLDLSRNNDIPLSFGDTAAGGLSAAATAFHHPAPQVPDGEPASGENGTSNDRMPSRETVGQNWQRGFGELFGVAEFHLERRLQVRWLSLGDRGSVCSRWTGRDEAQEEGTLVEMFLWALWWIKTCSYAILNDYWLIPL